MGAVFFVGFMVLILGGGLAAAIGGGVGLAVLRARQPRHKKTLTVLLMILLIGGIVIAMLPVGFFGFILWVNATPPENFVETQTVIEESGYQTEQFTADGVVYQSLELVPNYDICKDNSVPVFSYKTPGFWNRALWGNYYALENDAGFDLIWSPYGGLFCPADQADAVLAHYRQAGTVWYRIPEDGALISLNQELQNALTAMDPTSGAEESIPDEHTELWFQSNSPDGLICYDHITIAVNGNDAWLLTRMEAVPDRIALSYGVPLPPETAALFLSMR